MNKTSLIIANKLTPKEEKEFLYKDGLCLQHRKRVYLYWFKFLQQTILSSEHKVVMGAYSGWGTKQTIIDTKFDRWWDENWKNLFGMKKGKKPKFQLPPKIDYETVRLAYLVYELRDTPIEHYKKQMVRFHGRNMGGRKKLVRTPETKTNELSIAYRLFQRENPKTRFTALHHLNLDDYDNTDKSIQSHIRKLKKQSSDIMDKVCKGQFP